MPLADAEYLASVKAGRGRHGNHARGSAHYAWRVGGRKDQQGYVLVRVGRGHPLADPNGYAREHVVVWAAAGRLTPQPGECIHHRNGDRTDNRLDNLELLTRGQHNALHNRERGRNAAGRFLGGARAGHLLDGREHREWPR